jgi:hypothetical protein
MSTSGNVSNVRHTFTYIYVSINQKLKSCTVISLKSALELVDTNFADMF